MKNIARLMLVLALVMCANFVVALANPTNTNDFIFNPETGMITGYRGPGGAVKIPEAIGGKAVVKVGAMAFYECANIISIEIPDTVCCIGSSAFARCTNLKTIKFSDGSQLQQLGNHAFLGCKALEYIQIPERVAHISDGMFMECRNLIFVKLPDGLRSIGVHAFNGCNSLVSVTIPANTTDIKEGAFGNCANLEDIEFLGADIQFGSHIFDLCSGSTASYTRNPSLKVVVYDGSRAQWNAIVRGSENLTLENNPDLEVIYLG